MRWNKQALKKWILWSNPKDSAEKIALKRALQVHLVLLLLFSANSSPSFFGKPKQKLHVQTTYLEIKKGALAKEKSALNTTKKTSQPPPLQTKKRSETKQEASVAKHPQKPKLKNPSPQKRIEELEKNLKKIETSKIEPPKELYVAVEASHEVKETLPYESLVVHLLQKSLKLIDPESVDVHIFVNPNGIVDKILEIDSQSALNAKIVEASLEKMVFPGFESSEPIELHLHLCTGN